MVVISGLGPETEPTVGTDAADWLIKPVSEERLVQTVSSTLAHREQHGVVLLVEDDEDLAGVISTLLAGHGLDVVHATTAQEAVRLGSEVSPDVIVLDIRLPDSDGSTWSPSSAGPGRSVKPPLSSTAQPISRRLDETSSSWGRRCS